MAMKNHGDGDKQNGHPLGNEAMDLNGRWGRDLRSSGDDFVPNCCHNGGTPKWMVYKCENNGKIPLL